MAKYIPLSNSDKFAIVDDEVYDYLMKWKWRLSNNGYVYRKTKTNGRPRGIFMHREIVGLGPFSEDPVYIDHINGDKLDNRLDNLRLVSHKQNHANRGPNANNTSGYKGVSWRKDIQKWEARIKVDGRNIRLGCFYSKHDAARAYNEAAIKFFGEYAWLNEIREDEGDNQ